MKSSNIAGLVLAGALSIGSPQPAHSILMIDGPIEEYVLINRKEAVREAFPHLQWTKEKELIQGVGGYSGNYLWHGISITVPEGANLTSLAQDLSAFLDIQVSVEELYARNHRIIGENPDLLQPGMELTYMTNATEIPSLPQVPFGSITSFHIIQ